MNTKTIIIGADEVGFGCVFGNLVVAGVANPSGWFHPQVKDSKQIRSEKKRLKLATEIVQHMPWALASVNANVIDQVGLGEALRMCYCNVLDQLVQDMMPSGRPIKIILDGNERDLITKRYRSERVEIVTIPKADANFFEVSAASIVAKNARDSWIHELVAMNPALQAYHLDDNKGYGTPDHAEAIEKFGTTLWHRKGACKTLTSNKRGKEYAAYRASTKQ